MGYGEGAEVTIYDVAAAAGVAASTVSRALSKPGRVSFKTAEHVRQVAAELGYRSARIEVPMAQRGTGVVAMVVADIANPVFVGMVRGAERAAAQHDLTLAIIETQESVAAEQRAIERLEATVDGFLLASSRLTDQAIRAVAKRRSVVVLNRTVGSVTSVVSDNVRAIKKAVEHLVELGHTSIAYLAGPEASYADGMRWRGLKEAGVELDLRVVRVGPHLPTLRGGGAAAAAWQQRPTTAVIAYNDLMAIGFIKAVTAAGRRVPADVSVVGFDNIVDAEIVRPPLTTIAAPLVDIGSAAVAHLASTRRGAARSSAPDGTGGEPLLLPAWLVVRASTGPAAGARERGAARVRPVHQR
ncbi:transcriptional regulator, LacI family [Quadrisphaera granulorum]|uniref:LacI family transcriptional regulator n=1 Tax=Quadrisphaera granulorum TaxID=317664 RepID=A0A316A954_9ACTN|nr:LacI family DNA-binding transcriptional regulator [Quadrisphaera granulorum]PWJ54446.1 LacI family transcriptional regulator [Quadrisphaera granulorum]SZE96218.1 transcriptional regulator, LacI family [Quadrisphaera granulorum]